MRVLELVVGGFFDLCWSLYGPDEFALAVIVFLGPFLLLIITVFLFLFRIACLGIRILISELFGIRSHKRRKTTSIISYR